jgi:hypothetical protein
MLLHNTGCLTSRTAGYSFLEKGLLMSVSFGAECPCQNTRRVQKGNELLLYNILSTVPFKVVPSTDDTLSPTFFSVVGMLPGTHFVMARSSLIAFSRISLRVQKKTELFKAEHVHKLFIGLIQRTACARAQFSGCS